VQTHTGEFISPRAAVCSRSSSLQPFCLCVYKRLGLEKHMHTLAYTLTYALLLDHRHTHKHRRT